MRGIVTARADRLRLLEAASRFDQEAYRTGREFSMRNVGASFLRKALGREPAEDEAAAMPVDVTATVLFPAQRHIDPYPAESGLRSRLRHASWAPRNVPFARLPHRSGRI